MRLNVLLIGILAACSSNPDKAGADSGTAADPADGDDGGTTEDEGLTDEALLRAAIAGEGDPETVLQTIADSGGLPVATADGTVLFACVCGTGSWAVAGDHDEWTGTPMDQTGALWWAELALPEPDGARYKFTDGTSWIADPLGRRLAHDEFGEISLVAASAPHLERWYGVEGGGLAPRAVQVWVPQDGAFTHALYAHDGQNLFDPAAPWGGWRLAESLPPDMLVVGIDNTADRIDEYTHVADDLGDGPIGGRAEDHAALVDALRVRMTAAYGPAAVHGLLGSSLGGLASLVLAERDPASWDMALSLSGTMGWGSIGVDGETLLDRAAASGALEGTAIYLDSGGGGTCADSDGDGILDDGDDSDNFCTNRQLADQLAATTHTWDSDLWHWHEPGATHDEAAWAARVWRPLELFASR